MALDSGKFNINSTFDARSGLRYGRFTIGDYHATHRVLTVPEVFIHSSNIGTARMALGIGVEGHKAFLRKMGQLDRLETELPENAAADRSAALGRAQHHDHRLRPRPRRRAAAGVDGGRRAGQRRHADQADLPQARRGGGAAERACRCIKPETSEAMRYVMRLNASTPEGSAGSAVRRGLLRRRQDRHGREGHQRPLLQEQELHDLHGGGAGRQAEIRVPHHHGRAAGGGRHLRLLDRGLERRPRDRQRDRARRAAARRAAALRAAGAAFPADVAARRLGHAIDERGRQASRRSGRRSAGPGGGLAFRFEDRLRQPQGRAGHRCSSPCPARRRTA